MAWGTYPYWTNEGGSPPVGVYNIGKSKVKAVRAVGALRKTLRSFVGAHIFGHANKLTARYTRTKRSRRRNMGFSGLSTS
eukprot:3267968-Pleurochrysis_carterae.AAC.2